MEIAMIFGLILGGVVAYLLPVWESPFCPRCARPQEMCECKERVY